MKKDYEIKKIEGKGFILYFRKTPYIIRKTKKEVTTFMEAHEATRNRCKLCEPKLELRFFNPFDN